jgi:hypothetical protein
MNANAVARHYAHLTPKERFRLILAARARGDQAEQDRLMSTGQRIHLSLVDHAPYAQAFDELALLIFIELLEETARYNEAFARADEVHDLFGEDQEEDGDEVDEEEGDTAEEEESDAKADAESVEDDAGERPIGQRYLDLALAAGFVLRTKAAGWELFCERMTLPPFAVWEGLPGFDRLQRALQMAEKSAFAPEGFLRWLNAIRPAGEPERSEVPLTAEGMAAAAGELFRQRVHWWGG